MTKKQMQNLLELIEAADISLQKARQILAKQTDLKINIDAENLAEHESENQEKIIEGVFDGQSMIGPNGKEYSVPANYASKSKLVAGDNLKLTIKKDGSFVYKQIKAVDRKRIKGEIVMDEMNGSYAVIDDQGKKYNILTASVTYFKGEPGDIATIVVPEEQDTNWAAVENIIKASETDLSQTEQQTQGAPIESGQPENTQEDTSLENQQTASQPIKQTTKEEEYIKTNEKKDKTQHPKQQENFDLSKQPTAKKNTSSYQGLSAHAQQDNLMPDINEIDAKNPDDETTPNQIKKAVENQEKKTNKNAREEDKKDDLLDDYQDDFSQI